MSFPIKNKFIPAAFFALLASILLLPGVSRALTVGPAKIELNLDPGSSESGKIYLLNEGAETQTLYPSFEKFTETNGEKQFLVGEKTDLSSWFQMQQSVTLAPGESRDVPFTINIPSDASPGGHFAVIWWGTSPPNAQSGGGTSIVTRAGILVYLNVSGQIQEAAKIDEYGVTGGGNFFSWIPTDFKVVFENTGNVYLKPTGEIRVKNIFGITSTVMSVNKFGAEILPQSKKTITSALESVGWGGFGFGFYRAVLTLTYGQNNDKQISQETGFFVITWQIIIPIILTLLLIFWIATRGIKKYNRWVIKKALGGNNR